ncbi:asparagine synthase (glutamine-hydrolyzing) [Marinobacter orientalis]|uniref:asparagine synthase (glutamine-hydrolyzing) n=1 Tax=Marinobacter orientalis TaxID=1928859 RepID=A0A7Y0WTZ6_9GAMM|nr:asparagine synthase (glutamine-hydrolyzing) [Marinobacter orientalis]NMT65230.1 asparagine synthase (glutamine-hydrolyzing) [Marinobacter orientalis]TGX48002.1 asparagine synthase (glutamine-hydrolyzing) [Marinobacter orientalis]
MCGIAGFWQSHLGHSLEVATRMGTVMESRGPDDAGAWVEESAGLGLSHRRLAILDLSPAGHQPMHSPCGRYALVYNGEIYNHEDLRRNLDSEGGGFDWRGHSDTETLLAALRHWGIEKTLKQLNGMFAFALWDSCEQELFLARDRMGEKPLYYGRSGEAFLFGSELKALKMHPGWKGEIDRDALALYMRHNYVPAPWSIYQGISKLPPAHFVVIRGKGRDIGEPRCYWDLAEVAEKGIASASGGPEALEEELDLLLRDAVGCRMAADVPLGAFLSGGYDSTMVAAMMQAQSSRPVKTFTIGFHEEGYNEATHARAVADHLGTDHAELYVKPEDAMAVIPRLPSMYDEPFSDSSQIPTFLVSQLARKHVTVSLSGDGGDELFYGYDRYFRADRIWGVLSRVPMPLRRMMSAAASHAPGHSIEWMMSLLPERMRISSFADRLPKLAELLTHSSGEAFYRELVSHAKHPGQLVLGAKEPDTLLSQPELLPQLPGLRERMMYLDMMTYLPGDILTKVDRASMAVSLEARVPLLDHRVLEFAWRLPTEYKFRDGQGKWLLKQVLYRYVPREMMERPKMGFGVPVEHWLRGPLREWAEDLLNESRLAEEGFFDPVPIRKMWQEHISGVRRWHYHLWDVLMFQAWLREQA